MLCGIEPTNAKRPRPQARETLNRDPHPNLGFNRKMRLVFGVGLLALLGGFPVLAQFSGRVTGSVIDSAGAAVPGAEVELTVAGGRKAVLAVKTAGDGTYHFIGVRPSDYDLSVQAKGFVTATLRNLSVDAARETDVQQIRLQLATVSQSVDVVAESAGVETSSAEISGTISMADIRTLPILDRDPLGVLQTQPGVVSNGNSNTVINGLRTSYSSVTMDGINVQDNYLRDNALDYSPNKTFAWTGPADDAGLVQRECGFVWRRDRDGVLDAIGRQQAPWRALLGQSQQLFRGQRLVQ